MIGKPILQSVKLQDVVFAGGRGPCKDPNGASLRAFVALGKLGQLGKQGKVLEREDLHALREGTYPH